MASNFPDTAVAQSPTTKRARSARPRLAALRAAVLTAPSAISIPIPPAAGYSARRASRRQPVPVPRSSNRRGALRSGSRLSTASMTVSVSGRGSRVSADRLNSRPQNSRFSKMRLKGSPATMRCNSARTRLICCLSNPRSGYPKRSGGGIARAPETSRRACRRGSATPAADNAAAASATSRPHVPSASFNSSQPCSLILGQNCVDDLVQRLPAHHLVYFIEGEIDAVVGNSPLREIIGADPLRPVAAADLALPLGGACAVACLPFQVVKARAKNL